MNIDLKGCEIKYANIQLSKGDRIYNASIVDCYIDDVDSDGVIINNWAVNCRLELCKIRSQWEAENSFKQLNKG
jgi:hypothetical protein